MEAKPGVERRTERPTIPVGRKEKGKPVHLRVQMTVKIRCDGLSEEDNLEQLLDTVLEMTDRSDVYLIRTNLDANPAYN